MNQAEKDRLARLLGISKEDQQVLDAGSAHSFNCRCETCRRWWKKMGPQDADENGRGTDYGPFTKEEIEAP